MLFNIIIFLVTGIAAGVAVGFLGVGASLIILPVLIYLLPHFAIPHAQLMHVATGTSLACLTVGAFVAGITQLRHRPANWQLLKAMLPAYVLGASLGPTIARYVATRELQIYVGVLVLLIGLRLLFSKKAKVWTAGNQPMVLFGVGFFISLLASAAGIGNGLLLIPFYLKIGVPMTIAIPTSLCAAMLYTVIGCISFIVNGWSYHLPHSVGFIYLPAALGISIGILIGGPLGTRLSLKSSHELLRKAFAIFVIIAAAALLVRAF